MKGGKLESRGNQKGGEIGKKRQKLGSSYTVAPPDRWGWLCYLEEGL